MGYREELVKMLSAAGQDLMNHAEDYVPGDISFMQDITFSIRFEAPTDTIDVPSLGISCTFLQKPVIDILMKKGE